MISQKFSTQHKKRNKEIGLISFYLSIEGISLGIHRACHSFAFGEDPIPNITGFFL